MKWLVLISILTSSLFSSAQTRSTNAQLARGTDDSPAILRFAFVPEGSAPGQYTFTWEVGGAQDGTIFLSADCVPDTTIVSQGLDPGDGSPLACGTLHPLLARRGSIHLEFANHSRQSEIESVRLFVAGSKRVCSTMSVPVTAQQ